MLYLPVFARRAPLIISATLRILKRGTAGSPTELTCARISVNSKSTPTLPIA